MAHCMHAGCCGMAAARESERAFMQRLPRSPSFARSPQRLLEALTWFTVLTAELYASSQYFTVQSHDCSFAPT